MSHSPPTSELKKLACNWDLATLMIYQNKAKQNKEKSDHGHTSWVSQMKYQTITFNMDSSD